MTQFVTVDRATLEQMTVALEDSIDCVRHEYETYWGHGLPTRKARIDSMKESLDQHESAITAGRAALANAEPTCTWSKDPDFEMGDTYDSACGEKWSFIDGGPTENRVSFCQGCGKPVKIVQDTL